MTRLVLFLLGNYNVIKYVKLYKIYFFNSLETQSS